MTIDLRAALIALSAGAGAFAAILFAAPAPQPKPFEKTDIVCKTLKAESIRLVSGDKRFTIELWVGEKCAGVIVTGPTGHAQLHAGDDFGAWLGVDDYNPEKGGNCFAVGSGNDINPPFMQFVSPNGPKFNTTSIDKLIRIMELHK